MKPWIVPYVQGKPSFKPALGSLHRPDHIHFAKPGLRLGENCYWSPSSLRTERSEGLRKASGDLISCSDFNS